MVKQELEKLPRVSGGSTEAGKVYVTQRLNKLIVKAGDDLRRPLDRLFTYLGSHLAKLVLLLDE